MGIPNVSSDHKALARTLAENKVNAAPEYCAGGLTTGKGINSQTVDRAEMDRVVKYALVCTPKPRRHLLDNRQGDARYLA